MQVSAIVLCGGRGTRMGGVDKGLVKLANKPLVQHVIARIKPQVDEVIINANRQIDQYQTFNYPVVSDEDSDFIGPLAGFKLGLQHAHHDYLLTIPCDSPFIPAELVTRLSTHLIQHNAEIAVASSDGAAHPVFSLCKTSVLPHLQAYITRGERRVSAWQKSLRYVEVDFSDCSEGFINVNTLEDLAALALKLTHEP